MCHNLIKIFNNFTKVDLLIPNQILNVCYCNDNNNSNDKNATQRKHILKQHIIAISTADCRPKARM